MAELSPPRFVDGPALTLAGLVRPYTADTIAKTPNHWGDFRARLPLITGRVGGDAHGVWYDVLKGGREFSYFTGVRVGEFAPIHPDFSRVILTPLHYAVFVQGSDFREIRNTIDAIMTKWLPSSGRELSGEEGQPDFLERYTEEYNATAKGPIEIWVPLKKR